MIEEEWKDIKDFPGYQISNVGRVRSFKLFNAGRNMIPDRLVDEPHIMNTNSDDGNGYFKVMLRKGNKAYCRKIHRLVAEAFVPNPDNLETVDHISCDKKDNNYKNLRWVTRHENVSKAYRDGLHDEELSRRCQKVLLMSVPDGTPYLFKSVKDAADFLGVHYTTLSHADKDCYLVRGYYVEIQKNDRYRR